MAEFLIYDLKVAVLIAAFYFCYRLLMERETMHRLNRIVLLSSILLSLVLPLCVITLHKTVEVESPQLETSAGMPIQVADQPEQVITELGTISVDESVTPSIEAIVFAIFIIGLICRLLYIANSYRHLRRMIKDSEQHSLEDGVTLAVVDLPVAPFSWMRTIVLSRIDYEERNPSILAHERGHILLHHSWDIVFVEVLTALQWFNPVVWLLRRDLRTVHEYEADASVLSSGSDVSQYIQLLMRKAMGTKACTLANGINNSTTKKRIIMMLKHKSNKYTWLKVLYVVPVVAVSLAVTAKTVTDYKIKPTEFAITATTPTSAITTTTSEAAEAKPLTFKVVFLPENSPIVGVPVEVIVKGKTSLTTETAEKGLVKVNAPLGSTVRFTLIDRTKEVVVTKELLANSRVIAIGFEPKNEKKEAPDDESAIDDSEGNKVYDVVEDMPQFPGGQMELWEYLSKSLQYPEEAEKAGTQGRVIATFVVEKDGSITNARVVKALDSSLDAEALRVINAMPKWKPGMQNGVAVRCKYTVPVTFHLDGKGMPKGKSRVFVIGADKSDIESFYIEIDGVRTNKSMAQVAKDLNMDDIESMVIEQRDPKNPYLKIKTKKKL